MFIVNLHSIDIQMWSLPTGTAELTEIAAFFQQSI